MDSWPPIPAYVKLFAESSPFAPPLPPPPVEGEYVAFGVLCSTDPVQPTLASAGVQELSDGHSAVADLRKQTRSLVLQFAELVQGVVRGERGETEARLAAIECILCNMHYLVNSHRPQQAVDAAVGLVRLDIARQRRLAEELRQACDEAEAVLGGPPVQKKRKSE